MITVFVNGTFDVLHRGHIELLKMARAQGDRLIVAIDSDSRVKDKKGMTRPFNNQNDRLFMIESIRYVDEAHIFDSDEALAALTKRFSPDIMMVGSDWRGKPIVGNENSKEVRFFDRIDGYSTTKILDGNETCS